MTEPRVKTSNKFKGFVGAKNMQPMPKAPMMNTTSKKKPLNPTGPATPTQFLAGYKPIKGGGYSNGKTGC